LAFKFLGSPIEQRFFMGDDGSCRVLSEKNEKFVLKNHPHSESTEVGGREYVRQYLNQRVNPFKVSHGKKLTYLDLFCGGGGLSLGVHHALDQFGLDAKLVLASDIDKSALRLIEHYFKPMAVRSEPIEQLIKYGLDLSGDFKDFTTPPKITDGRILQFKGKIDLLVGGPPCQGHSNLNNKTRRHDPRNLLYYVMPAFAIALDIPCLIIENVKSIKNASENVVLNTKNILESNGYHVREKILNATDFGIAQTRSRHFLIASKIAPPNIDQVADDLKMPTLSFDDINDDLPAHEGLPSILTSPAQLSEKNKMRIQHLHDTGSYNLKNDLRPECHQDGHTYPAVYGRIKPNLPVGTITTGFSSPGRGRYIHPREPRMITIREAARLQSFPDWYFSAAEDLELPKTALYKIIGDAVPPLLVYPLIVSLWDSFKELKSL
tara:strand:- start:85 stop:1389 length:1305 start_codon:yes stop_codon:yes gene_type:complete